MIEDVLGVMEEALVVTEEALAVMEEVLAMMKEVLVVVVVVVVAGSRVFTSQICGDVCLENWFCSHVPPVCWCTIPRPHIHAYCCLPSVLGYEACLSVCTVYVHVFHFSVVLQNYSYTFFKTHIQYYPLFPCAHTIMEYNVKDMCIDSVCKMYFATPPPTHSHTHIHLQDKDMALT